MLDRRRLLFCTCRRSGWHRLLPARALAAPLSGSDYRALVCVFLYGGNDGNNMVVPMDTTGYAAYAKARGVAGTGGLSLDRGTLAPLGSSQLGLHAALAPLADVFNQGHLAVQLNVGTLVKPITRRRCRPRPATCSRTATSRAVAARPVLRGQQHAFGHRLGRARGRPAAGRRRAHGALGRGQQRLHVRRVLAGACRSAPATASPSGALATPPPAPCSRSTKACSPSPMPMPRRAAASVLNQAIKASTALNTALSMNSSLSGLFSGLSGQPRAAALHRGQVDRRARQHRRAAPTLLRQHGRL